MPTISSASLRAQLRLPAICAPMFLISNPALVAAACSAGLIGGLPRHNLRSRAAFDAALSETRALITNRVCDRIPGPIAVNLDTRLATADMQAELAVCRKHGVEIIVSAGGDPAALTRQVHDWGGIVLHDVTNFRFAERAIAAGVDGLIAIGSGGGGQSGAISPFVLIPRLREMFDGIIVMAGAVSTGAAIRAAEVLGADAAYLGTRFIATRESAAPEAYKAMLLAAGAADIVYSDAINGVPASWLQPSLLSSGLDPDDLPERAPGQRGGHLPPHAKPWKTVWSAGQGVELIRDLPTVAELVDQLSCEYSAACSQPSMPFGGLHQSLMTQD
jgi:nitronate monooxygenase